MLCIKGLVEGEAELECEEALRQRESCQGLVEVMTE